MKFKTSLYVLSLFLLFLTAACGLPGSETPVKDIKEDDPGASYHIRGVPFFPQDEYMCGPAALASVISYWGADTGMKDVAKEVYEEKLKGTLPMDLLIFAKEKGFDAAYYRGSIGDLKEKVSSKTPLILFLNMGFDFYPVGHYIVVTGYNDRMGEVIAHSGMEKDTVYTYRELERFWGKTGYSTLLVRPKGKPQ